MIQLTELIKNIDDLEIFGSNQIAVNNVSNNSKKIKSGDIYIAIKGSNFDGHDFIDDAIKEGAVCIVCEVYPLIRLEDITYIITKSSKETYSRICSNYFDNPSHKLKLIGITGTNGKTSCTSLMHQMFNLNRLKCGLISTNKIIVGSKEYDTNLTTPDSYDLNYYLNEMIKIDIKYCFMEVSSHSIDQRRISGLKYELAIFTNITHDHLNYHKNFKNYLNVKKKFFDDLDNNAHSLINSDDKNSKYIIQNTKSKVHTYSISKNADFKLKVVENSFDGLVLKIEGIEVNTKLIGKFNAYNLLTVFSVSKILKINTEKILISMSLLKNPEGRFDVIIKNKIIGIVDYAHTPDALLNVLETIVKIKQNENSIITVVGCGGGRDRAKRLKMGSIASRLSQKVIFTSDNPRDEDPKSIIDDMIAGVDDADKSKILNIVDRKEAIVKASKVAKPNDILLVAGKGHEKYQIIKSKKIRFNDKEILTQTLKMAV